jgi:branched-chain amino acid transport system ATP-binding protein
VLLDVRDLRAGYGRHEVLGGVSLHVDAGELVCIVGSNGAGKSTLLRTLCGSMRAKAGQIVFDGRNVTKLPTWKIVRLGLGHVPEGRHVFKNLSVLDHLHLGARAAGRGRSSGSLSEIFELFPRLQERQKQKAGSMSGGEQQMLVIARALMGKPDLMLIDEPSLGLAPLAIESIFDAIVKMRAHGQTTVVVEQNARLALEISDRAYVLEHGAIALEGPSADLLHDPRVIDAYLNAGAVTEPGA